MSPLLIWLLHRLAAVLRLFAAAILAALIWAAPRIWRGALAAVDLVEATAIAARDRWDSRHDAVVLAELPAQHALAAAPSEDLRWSVLSREAR